MEEMYSRKSNKISDLAGLVSSGKGISIFEKQSVECENETRNSHGRFAPSKKPSCLNGGAVVLLHLKSRLATMVGRNALFCLNTNVIMFKS